MGAPRLRLSTLLVLRVTFHTLIPPAQPSPPFQASRISPLSPRNFRLPQRLSSLMARVSSLAMSPPRPSASALSRSVSLTRRPTVASGASSSSALLYEETLFQNAEDGTPFVDIMKANNVIPGIKVDTGVRATFADGETITEGIE